jgi:sulfopyruvate decarboxylase subunit beta
LVTDNNRICPVEALEVLRAHRTEEVVVTTMGTSREWMRLSAHPLDFNYVPSSMGQATSLGLGVALAQPNRKVVVCNGDGSMLMNLGTLVTITAQAPANYTLILFENGAYEVTGAQGTPGSETVRGPGRAIDYADIARGCGFESVFQFDTLDDWRSNIANALNAAGPTFVWLKVALIPGSEGPKSPGPSPERATRFAAALQSGS